MNNTIAMQQMMMAGIAAPPSGYTARYWRLYITATQANDGYINARLIGLNAAVGDLTNRCPVVGGTATESSIFGGSYFSINAWLNSKEDGTTDQASFWHSDFQSTPWWTIFDCGSGNTITANEIALCGVNIAGRMPKDFLVQTSPDGSAWTTVIQRAGVTGWDTTTPKFFTLGTSSLALSPLTIIIPTGATGSRALQPTVAGLSPYIWSSGTLPSGVTLVDGVLYWDGTQTLQTVDVDFTVEDDLDVSATATFTIDIAAPTIATICFGSGERGAWFDPSDLSTMFQDTAGTTPVTATGQKVALLKDKSGNGQDLMQGTSAAQPTLQQDGNGNYNLGFSGAQFMYRATTNSLNLGTDSMMVVTGAKFATSASYQCIYSRCIAGSEVGQYAHNRGDAGLAPFYEGPGGLIQPGIADTSASIRVLSAVVDRTGGSLKQRIDASEVSSGTFVSDISTDETNARRFLIGAYNETDSSQIQYLTGDFYGLVIRMADIDSTVLDFTESYMTSQTS